jgi:hypothetical protein
MIPPPSPKPRLDRQTYLRTLARMTASQRVMKAFELSDMTKQLLRDGLRKRFPDKSDAELHEIYLARLDRCHNQNY